MLAAELEVPSRRDEHEAWEVGPVPARVACQELVATHRGVRSDVEVGERGRAPPATPAIRQEALPRQERCLVRQRIAAVELGREDSLEVLDAVEADGPRRTR